MSANKISKVVYAQSSDIKSRTYLEYRRDMKKKAIAELEVREWLEGKLREMHKSDEVRVEKSGYDRYMWFARSGKISGEPDYTAVLNDGEQKFEFQYAESGDLKYYDFKISKVGKKHQGKRIPHADRMFLYVIMADATFAIFTPQWIADNGNEETVAAWGNRSAFRVPQSAFKKIFKADTKLAEVARVIDRKNRLLDAQVCFLENENSGISRELQKVVDENSAFTIIPKTLDGFYRACFLMDKVGKYPKNYSMWLVYGASMYSGDLNSYEFAKLVYALDFLHGGTIELEENVLAALVEVMKKFAKYIARMQEQELKTCNTLSPKQEAINFLFAVNLYEDMAQELRSLYEVRQLPQIKKIFQSVDDIDLLCGMI